MHPSSSPSSYFVMSAVMAQAPQPHAPALPANNEARAVDSWFASVSIKEIAPQDYPLITVDASDNVEAALRVRAGLPFVRLHEIV